MAKDLPEYQRQTGIQPQTQPQDYVGPVTQANAGINAIGRLGAQVASSAANEQAEILGRQKAQENIERSLIPAFTDSDKAFNDAFRSEQYKVLANQAKVFIDKTNFDYSKIVSPTPEDIRSYKTTMDEFLGGILSMSDLKNHADLERSFADSADYGMYQLAGRVEDASRKKLIDTSVVNTENNLKDIINYYRLGMVDAAQKSYDDELRNIESVKVLTGEAGTAEKINNLNLTRDLGIYGGQLMTIQTQQGTEAASQYLRKFAEKAPEGMDTTRHQVLAGELYKMYANYQKQIGMNQAIESSKANLELESNGGILWPERWQEIKSKVSPEDYNKLLVKSMHMQQANDGLVDAINYTLKNASNPVAMGRLTSGQMDKVFDAFMQQTEQYAQDNGMAFDPLINGGDIAQNIAAPISRYQDMLEKAVNFGDPESAAKAAAVIKMLKKNNPIALDGVDKATQDMAALFDNYRRSTRFKDPIEALKQAQNDIYDLSEEEKARRDEVFNKYWKDQQYDKNPEKWYKEVAKNLEVPSNYSFPFSFDYAMPSDLPIKAKSLLRSYVERFGNMETAKEQMFEDMKMAYHQTDTNNRHEVMELPPNFALKDVNIGYWQDNDKTLALYRYIKSGEAMQRDPNSFLFNKVEWPNNPYDQYMKIDGHPIEFKEDGSMTVNGERITKQQFFNALPSDIIMRKMVEGDIKIMVDGKERKIIIESDDYTSIPYNGLPSWKFSYLDDNDVPQPLMGITQSGGVVRWYPNLEILDSVTKKITQQEQEQANINAAMQKSTAQKIFEQRTNPTVKPSQFPPIIPGLYGEDLGSDTVVEEPKK